MITKFKIFEQNGLKDSHIELIDFIIDNLIKIDFDYHMLEVFLNKIDRKYLIGALSEEESIKFKKYKRKNENLILDVCKQLYDDHKIGDYTVLDELLGFISEDVLLKIIPEKWKIEKNMNKYNI